MVGGQSRVSAALPALSRARLLRSRPPAPPGLCLSLPSPLNRSAERAKAKALKEKLRAAEGTFAVASSGGGGQGFSPAPASEAGASPPRFAGGSPAGASAGGSASGSPRPYGHRALPAVDSDEGEGEGLAGGVPSAQTGRVSCWSGADGLHGWLQLRGCMQMTPPLEPTHPLQGYAAAAPADPVAATQRRINSLRAAGRLHDAWEAEGAEAGGAAPGMSAAPRSQGSLGGASDSQVRCGGAGLERSPVLEHQAAMSGCLLTPPTPPHAARQTLAERAGPQVGRPQAPAGGGGAGHAGDWGEQLVGRALFPSPTHQLPHPSPNLIPNPALPLLPRRCA